MGGRGGSSGMGKVYGGQMATLTEKQLNKLISMGATRWTNYGKDRLYLRGAGDKIMGLDVDTYRTGNISGATRDGEKISNRTAYQMRETYENAYLDLNTGAVHGVSNTRYYDDFIDAINKYRKKKK